MSRVSTDAPREVLRQRGSSLVKIGGAAWIPDVFVWVWWRGHRSFASFFGFLAWILGFFGLVLVIRGVTGALWPPKRNPFH